MSFVIRKTAYRAWPVSIRQLESDANGVVTETVNTFVAHFAPFTEAQLEEARLAAEAAHPVPKVVKEGEHPEASDAKQDALPSIALVLARAADLYAGSPPGAAVTWPPIVVGWGSEVKDESGAPISFSANALRALVNGPDGYAAMLGFATALGELRFGNTPEKNSVTSAAPGPTPAAVEAAPTS